jgi:hypothetical protein
MSPAFTEREVRPEDEIDPKTLKQMVGQDDDATFGKDTDQTPSSNNMHALKSSSQGGHEV